MISIRWKSTKLNIEYRIITRIILLRNENTADLKYGLHLACDLGNRCMFSPFASMRKSSTAQRGGVDQGFLMGTLAENRGPIIRFGNQIFNQIFQKINKEAFLNQNYQERTD
jgi:hypothetical protein